MAKTEQLLAKIAELEATTGVKRTVLAVCPNSTAVIRASFRAAKRNNAPICFAATLNQIDGDGGYTGMTQAEFTRLLRLEAGAVNYTGMYIVAVDHGGPWLKDIQARERWSLDRAMDEVKRSLTDAVEAGYDLLHVDPTVDILIPEGQTIDIVVVARRTAELIEHVERFRTAKGLPAVSYEVGTEEVHGGLADSATFDTFISELRRELDARGLAEIWPVFIVGKVGTDLHTTTFDPVVARDLAERVRPLGSYIKGHYSDGVTNPEQYPTAGMGGANVGPEFTIGEYEALAELEGKELELASLGEVAQLSNITAILQRLVDESGRWQKWLLPDEKGFGLDELRPERRRWIVMTCCRYVWQKPEALVARAKLYDNLRRMGMDPEAILLGRIEHDMDRYFTAFNLTNLNDLLN